MIWGFSAGFFLWRPGHIPADTPNIFFGKVLDFRF